MLLGKHETSRDARFDPTGSVGTDHWSSQQCITPRPAAGDLDHTFANFRRQIASRRGGPAQPSANIHPSVAAGGVVQDAACVVRSSGGFKCRNESRSEMS
jgi:hypothetical protein